MREDRWYERLFYWFLRKIGLLETHEVSKEEMCKLAQSQCNHHCTYCAWNTEEDTDE